MKAVGIKRLKARLSEYVRLAKSGETILVTEHEEVVAELRPSRRGVPAQQDDWADLAESLEEAGELTRAELPKTGFTWAPRATSLPEGTAERLLSALREDTV